MDAKQILLSVISYVLLAIVIACFILSFVFTKPLYVLFAILLASIDIYLNIGRE